MTNIIKLIGKKLNVLSIRNIKRIIRKLYLKHLPEKAHSINVIGRKVHFTSGPQLLHSIEELLEEEIYFFKSKNKTPFIIDCGCNIGLSILYFKKIFPNSEIIGFEPDELNHAIAQKNIEENELKNVNLIKKAIWVKDEELNFSTGNGQGSSIDINATSTVQAVALKSYLTREIDLLKIDIEGAEYEVMQSVKSDLDSVKNIFVEYHGNDNETNKLIEILQILQNSNFKVYIQEAARPHKRPFSGDPKMFGFDVQLNIFGKRI